MTIALHRWRTDVLTDAKILLWRHCSAYKAAHASDADALLAERGRIDNSHSMMDRTLE